MKKCFGLLFVRLSGDVVNLEVSICFFVFFQTIRVMPHCERQVSD